MRHTGGIYYYQIYDGEIAQIDPARFRSDWSDSYTHVLYPNKVFDSSAKVNKVHCFVNSNSYDSTCIYYATNHGEYILHREDPSADKTYLFPISDFCAFSKEYYSYQPARKNPEGRIPPVEELFDEEKFLFTPRDVKPENQFSFPWLAVGITAAVVLVAVGIAGYLWHRKKASNGYLLKVSFPREGGFGSWGMKIQGSRPGCATPDDPCAFCTVLSPNCCASVQKSKMCCPSY